jgi:hypothetical protein
MRINNFEELDGALDAKCEEDADHQEGEVYPKSSQFFSRLLAQEGGLSFAFGMHAGWLQFRFGGSSFNSSNTAG